MVAIFGRGNLNTDGGERTNWRGQTVRFKDDFEGSMMQMM